MAMRSLTPWSRGQLGRSRDLFDEINGPFEALHNRIERAFNDVWSGLGGPPLSGDGQTRALAATDICETDNEIEVCVDLPGFEEKDIDLSVDDHSLTIKAETAREEEQERKGYLYSERRRGKVFRTIPLPRDVDRDKVSASYDKGVLTVRLPKTEAARTSARHIPLTPPGQAAKPGQQSVTH